MVIPNSNIKIETHNLLVAIPFSANTCYTYSLSTSIIDKTGYYTLAVTLLPSQNYINATLAKTTNNVYYITAYNHHSQELTAKIDAIIAYKKK